MNALCLKVWSHIQPPMFFDWPKPRKYHAVCQLACDDQEIKVLLLGGCDSREEALDDCWLLDIRRSSGIISKKVSFDGEPFIARFGHSVGCLPLFDGRVVISVFGGHTAESFSGDACFYLWDPCRPSVLHSCQVPPAEAVLPIATVSEQEIDKADDVFLVLDTTTESPVQSITSDEIGEEGGTVDFQSSEVQLIVPKGAVPPATSFCLKTYMHPRILPPFTSKDEVALSPVFQLSSSLPETSTFNKPLELSLPPEVPIRAASCDSGWLLELKRSDSYHGLPEEWHTVLEVNTKTGTVVSHSPFVQYDLETETLYLRKFSWLSWLGTALQSLSGSTSTSLRNIQYALFGQKVECGKWKIAVHIFRGSQIFCESLALKLKQNNYVELNHPPNTDSIGLSGDLFLQVQCQPPWQLHQGESETWISTDRIWGSEREIKNGSYCSCYYEFTVKDTGLADTLEITISASFQSKGEKVARHPVPLIIAHPLKSQPKTPGVIESGVSKTFHDPEMVLSAVLKHGPHQWYTIGRLLGFSVGQVKSDTGMIPSPEEKLRVLFDIKANRIGRGKAAAELLEVCKRTTPSILGAVMDELKPDVGVSKEVGKEAGEELKQLPSTGLLVFLVLICVKALEILIVTEPVLLTAACILIYVILAFICNW